MKRVLALMMSAMILACTFTGCSSGSKTETGVSTESTKEAEQTEAATTAAGTEAATEAVTAEASGSLNLMDMYTVQDPEGVEYDRRVALYAPVLESDDNYALGIRSIFVVLYGKENKGVYMYTVTIFDTEENAAAYKETAGAGEVDGIAHISESDESFFAAMEAFIPDFQTYIDNMGMSGMIEVE